MPAVIRAINWPNVIDMLIRVTSRPRRCVGLHSLTYTGTVHEAIPTKINHIRYRIGFAFHVLRCAIRICKFGGAIAALIARRLYDSPYMAG